MKHPVKTLAALALVGAVAPAFAVSIKDDQMSLAIKGVVQGRAELLNNGSNATGGDYDPLRGTNGDAEAVRFDARRARFGLEAKMGDWKAVLTIRAEKNDTTGSAGGSSFIDPGATANGGAATSNANRGLQLYYANIQRSFKLDDGVALAVRGGLDKAYNAESSISSSAFLFSSDTVVDERIEQRNLGVGSTLTSPFINAGFDIQNNSTTTKDGDASAANQKNGMFYSARLEFSPVAEWMPAKKVQSFVGKEGTHLVIGADVQMDDKNLNGAAAAAGGTYVSTKTVAYGPDVLFHWNGLTAYGEFRMSKANRDVVAGAALADVKGRFWNIQAGYAMPVFDIVIEPAIRFSKVDSDTGVTNTNTGYNAGAAGGAIDNGGDGRTIDIGVNLYFDGHNNKLGIALQSWKAEAGSADASIIRIQQQISF